MLFRVCSLVCVCSVVLNAEFAVGRPPNVIMILADDLGSVDLRCYGADDLMTPELDRLAKRGVRFTQCYAAAPVCSPSRAAFITGRYPQRAGVPGNVPRNDAGGMPTDVVTVAEMFARGGYATGHVGKWHLGHHPSKTPNGQGFQESFGHLGGCIDNYSHFFYWDGPNEHDLWRNGQEVFHEGRYFPDLMADEAIRFISGHQDEPFFLYWALNVPHYPLQPSERWRRHYRDLPPPRRHYAAFVSTMDETVGRVLRHLDHLHLTNSTIVVFQSDHGHSTEIRTFGGGGCSGPYRGAKFSLFEGGIRVPAMISWPGTLPRNAVRSQMVTGCDWVPTLLALAGLPDEPGLDGHDITDVIRSPSAPGPHSVFHWQSGRTSRGPQWAVRRGPWKLLAHPRDTTAGAAPLHVDRFLVNLDESVSEQTNLLDAHPDIAVELEQLHEIWVRDVRRK